MVLGVTLKLKNLAKITIETYDGGLVLITFDLYHEYDSLDDSYLRVFGRVFRLSQAERCIAISSILARVACQCGALFVFK